MAVLGSYGQARARHLTSDEQRDMNPTERQT
jgi:hypothetical protein